jgi:epothilone polyketide synthase D
MGALALAGSPVDWRRYDQPYGRQKTALPTYPFQRQRFWPDMLRAAEGGTDRLFATARPPAVTASLGRVEWCPVPWPQSSPLKIGRWLLLADAGGVAARLAERLRSAGAEVTMLRSGLSSGIDGACRRISPGDAAEWRRLLASLSPLAGVVHLWSLDLPVDPACDAIDGILSHCIEPVLAMARRHAEGDAIAAAPVWIVTAGAAGPGARRPAAASLWGLARVQHAEQPDSLGGVLDLQVEPGADDAAALLRLLASSPAGGRFAVRNGVCLAERLVLVGDASMSPVLDPQAAYLVTGGLGGLGLVVARALARWGGRRLVLLGRRPHVRTTAAIVDEFGAMGVAVDIRAVDIAEAAALTSMLAELDGKSWRLAGVIHAAGVLDDGLLAGETADRVRGVLAPKVAGAINLHRLTQGRRLDFLVLFSSVAGGIGGGVGQGSYAAANAFLDALAEYRQQHGLPGRSILWGPWATGMGARLQADRLAAAGLRPLSTEEGTRLLAGALSRSEPALVAAAADWTRIIAPQPGAEDVASVRPVAPLAELDRADATERRIILSAYVDRVIRAVLLLPEGEPVGAQQSLLDFGFDSMSAANLRNRLAADTGVELPLPLLLSGASLERLAEVLGDRLAASPMTFAAPSPSDDGNPIEEFVL